MTRTETLGLALPEPEDLFSLDDHWNANSQIIDDYARDTDASIAGIGDDITAIQTAIAALSAGVKLKGAKNYYADLPTDPELGDAYTVRYSGTSGTDPLGVEYVWTMMDNGIIVVPTWVPLGADPGTYAKAADLTAAEAALADVIDNGPKNRLSVNAGTTGSGAGYFVQDLPIALAPGDYVWSMKRTGNASTTFVVKAADDTELAKITRGAGVTDIVSEFSTSDTAAKISIYVGYSTTVTDAMICSKAAYEISSAFVPYAPTNAELYAMIQAAQQA